MYDELAKHGEWIDFEDYGPVWRPSGVTENWRPYLDGRWAPTDQGYVFETKEPWGVGHLPLRQLDAHGRLGMGLGAGPYLVSQHRGVAD
ncbi:MAG: hypothetical protein FJ134_00695 [Deltaproteobacteria bacterium]|nr:hypothetical protein [Deltaproteobacteria bacterium]